MKDIVERLDQLVESGDFRLRAIEAMGEAKTEILKYRAALFASGSLKEKLYEDRDKLVATLRWFVTKVEAESKEPLVEVREAQELINSVGR